MANKDKVHSNLKSLVKASFLISIGIVLSKLLTYAYRITIARQLGPEAYGLFTLALMTIGWFIIFSKMGLTGGLIRYTSVYRGKEDSNRIRYLFKKSSSILLTTGILAGAILFFFAEFISVSLFHNVNLIFFLKVFSIAIPMTMLLDILLAELQAFEKVGWHSFIFNILQNSIRIFMLALLLYFGFQTNAVIFSYLLGVIISLAFAYLIARIKIPDLFGKFNLNIQEKKAEFKQVFDYSWPLLFFGLITSIFYWTDTLMLGIFKGVTTVGIYGAATSIAFILGTTPELFMNLFFPMVNKEYSRKNTKLIRELSQQIGKWIFALNLPILILVVLFPGAIINVLFGSQYLQAENALRLLALGAFITSIFDISNKLITVTGRTKVVLADVICSALLNLIFNLIFVPIWGINGAALSTLLSLIVLNLLFIIQANHYLSIIPLKKTMWGILSISAVPTVILLLLRSFFENMTLTILILFGVIFFGVYILLIVLTGCLDKNDIKIIDEIKKRVFGKSLANDLPSEVEI